MNSFYMATELGYVKSKEAAFDGTNKIFEELRVKMANQTTYTAMAGKAEAERQALAAMLTIIERSAAMTAQQSKNLVYTGSDGEQKTARGANDLLYAILAMNRRYLEVD